jgi:hypothetical protein
MNTTEDDDGTHGTPSWIGKDPRQMTKDERTGWAKAIGKAVSGLRKLTGRERIVHVVVLTTYPESVYQCIGPVKRGQYVSVPKSPAGTIPAGNYPIVAIGWPMNGYHGATRWCYPVTTGGQNKPYMSGIDPDAWQQD